MQLEIERKFLVQGDGYRAASVECQSMEQGYLGGELLSVRVRICADRAWLNLKSKGDWRHRIEFEYPIPRDHAECLLAHYALPGVISKRRYRVPAGRHYFEVDEFDGANAGLVIAEIELSDPDEAFLRPPWLGREVTGDSRYMNVMLAQRPYGQWSELERRGAE